MKKGRPLAGPPSSTVRGKRSLLLGSGHVVRLLGVHGHVVVARILRGVGGGRSVVRSVVEGVLGRRVGRVVGSRLEVVRGVFQRRGGVVRRVLGRSLIA